MFLLDSPRKIKIFEYLEYDFDIIKEKGTDIIDSNSFIKNFETIKGIFKKDKNQIKSSMMLSHKEKDFKEFKKVFKNSLSIGKMKFLYLYPKDIILNKHNIDNQAV